MQFVTYIPMLREKQEGRKALGRQDLIGAEKIIGAVSHSALPHGKQIDTASQIIGEKSEYVGVKMEILDHLLFTGE